MDENELEIERQKLEHEERRVRIEERKVSQAFWTRFAVVVPIIAALIALFGTLWARHEDSRDRIELQQRQAQDAFELAAVDLVMGGETAFDTLTRAKAIKQLFPNRLPDDFAATFDPESTTDFRFRTIASKKDLLNLLAAHPGQRQLILDTWRQLFPGDVWAKDIE